MELYLQKRKSYIFSAIIKYGYSNFTLEIIEYCDKLKVIEREQFYIDLLRPKYNLLQVAAHVLVLNIRMRLGKKCLYLKKVT
jgi:group I intron endonuclease